ncbi:hypothetical protein SprV_0100487600 [Sparganum proliferum]
MPAKYGIETGMSLRAGGAIELPQYLLTDNSAASPTTNGVSDLRAKGTTGTFSPPAVPTKPLLPPRSRFPEPRVISLRLRSNRAAGEDRLTASP